MHILLNININQFEKRQSEQVHNIYQIFISKYFNFLTFIKYLLDNTEFLETTDLIKSNVFMGQVKTSENPPATFEIYSQVFHSSNVMLTITEFADKFKIWCSI